MGSFPKQLPQRTPGSGILKQLFRLQFIHLLFLPDGTHDQRKLLHHTDFANSELARIYKRQRHLLIRSQDLGEHVAAHHHAQPVMPANRVHFDPMALYFQRPK
jgi:hypothetical protein